MIRTLILALSLSCTLGADTLALRDGRTIQGTFLGGTSRQIRMEVGDRVETYAVTDVKSLHFETGPVMMPYPAGGAAQPTVSGAIVTAPGAAVSAPAPASTAPASSTGAPAVADSGLSIRPAPAPPQGEPAAAPSGREVPAGTSIVVRTIDPIDSQNATVGQTFAATTDEPVVVNGETLIRRGAEVVVRLVEDKESGRLTGRAELALALDSIKVDGRVIPIVTEEVRRQSESRSRASAMVIGGTAAVGALIGAIAGGGTGAAVGAAAGAGAGTGAQVLTKGQRVRIPPETRLSFALQSALRL
jgi:hypothetical protein